MIRVLALFSQGTWNGSWSCCADSSSDKKLSMWLKGLLGLEVVAKIALVTYLSWIVDGKNGFSDFDTQTKGSIRHASCLDERSRSLLTEE